MTGMGSLERTLGHFIRCSYRSALRNKSKSSPQETGLDLRLPLLSLALSLRVWRSVQRDPKLLALQRVMSCSAAAMRVPQGRPFGLCSNKWCISGDRRDWYYRRCCLP